SLQSQKAVARQPRTLSEYGVVYGTIGFMAFFLLSPLLALFLQSITDKTGFTTRFFADLGQVGRGSVFNVPPIEAVKNSVIFASITTILAVILGVLLAMLLHTQRKNRLIGWLDALVMLPLATSAVTLGFGFIIGFSSPPMAWRSEWWLIPISHTLVALPFVVRSVLPALRAIPKQIHEAGMMLGVGQWGRWYRLELPLVSKGVVVGAIFAFTVSLGEFGASLFIVRNNMPTISIVIYRFLGRAGTYGQALAMSVILLMVSAIAFLILERLRARGVGEF
ncbi:MAG: ABC transporter permease subunit, partial [Anaerolineae bacterium]|nr:ABC transporter permease subunit [Anaerolineae bacterium]